MEVRMTARTDWLTRATVLLALCAVACHRKPSGGPALGISVKSPAAEAALDEIVLVGFDRKVVRKGPSGLPPVPSGIVMFQPAIEGTAHWIDESTLAFTPKTHWPIGIRVDVTISDSLRGFDGAALKVPVRWSFETPHARIVSVSPSQEYEVKWIKPDQVFDTHWSLPTSVADAERHCSFLMGDRTVPVSATLGPLPETAPRERPGRAVQLLRLSPKTPLSLATAGKLVCKGAGEHGDFVLPFTTYGDLRVVEHGPASGVVADSAEVKLTFSNPVDPDDVLAHLTIEPKPGRGALNATSRSDATVVVGGTYAASVQYTVTVRPGVRDSFGQKLATEHSFSFTPGDNSPQLALHSGLYVVESSQPLYPVFTRNVQQVEVRVAKVPEERIVPFLTTLHLSESLPAPNLSKLGIHAQVHGLDASGKHNHWKEGTLNLPALAGTNAAPRGLYYIEGFAPETEKKDQPSAHRIVASVTDLGLVAKIATSQGLVWVNSLATGKPVAGAQIAIRDKGGKVKWSGKTDASGLAMTPGWDKLTPAATKRRGNRDRDGDEGEGEGEGDDFDGGGDDDTGGNIYIIAKNEGDLAVLSDRWRPGTAAWAFGVSPERTPGSLKVRGFIETDRGLYRPGDTVHIKGLVRTATPGAPLRVPAKERAAIQVVDPRDEVIFDKTVTTGAFGGFAFDLPTGAEAHLGDYRISATVRGQSFRENFSVQEYRPATFQVELRPLKPSYMIGEKLSAHVRANYFYGAPLRQARVQYSVRLRDRYVTFDGELAPYTFSDSAALEAMDYGPGRDSSRSDLLSDGEAKTDKDGNFTFSVPLKADKSILPQDVLIEAEVADESGQSRHGQVVVPAHSAALYVGVKADWLAAEGQPIKVNLVATDTQGKRIAARQVNVAASLRTWKCGASSLYFYHCEPKDEPLEARTVDIPASGTGETTFVVTKPGELVLRATAKDASGRATRASQFVYVWGAGETSWRDDNTTHMNLTPDKKQYKPGDTARVLVQAPYPGTALVTVERDAVLSSRLVELKMAETIEVPLSERDLPNVYVSVVLIKGRTGKGDGPRPKLRMGLTTLNVVPDRKRLTVSVAADQAEYRPGSTVTATIKVVDAAGAPVRAEVALAAADEGVLSLVAYKTPDPMAIFYAPWSLGVETATSYERFAHRSEPEDDEAGVGDGAGDLSENRHVRSHFLPTAFWHPALHTEPDGTAKVTFTAPDQLTAFRLMAVAADAGDRFGSSDSKFRVAKPFALHPMLPRFLVVGDDARVGVVVENDTAAAGQVTIDALVSGVVLRGERKRRVTVPAGARVPVVFDARAEQSGSARFRFSGALGKDTDDVEVTLPVEEVASPETRVVLEGSTTTMASAQVAEPGDAIPGTSTLDVALDGTGLAGVSEGLRYLIEYPYGCLEQTTSRVVPLVALSDLAGQLQIAGIAGPKLRHYIEAGVAKIERFQAEDGQFSLWQGGQGEPYLTAFALYGLKQAQAGGFKVSQQTVDRGLDALHNALRTHNLRGGYHEAMGDAGSRAFALYVLGEWGRPDPGMVGEMFGERSQLPRFGKAFLLRALLRSGGDPAQVDTLIGEITAGAVPRADGVLLPEPDGGRLAYYFSDDVRSSEK
jgi:uncharacterized protein YfaS (alpha-2-macroglobulin family)